MPGSHGLEVDAAQGDRWELALVLLESGDGSVRAGAVSMSRNTAGPRADGRIHVSIECAVDPDFLARGAAEADLERGLAQVREMARVDPRFASLMNQFGVVREYVWDYGMGGVRLATVREDDTVDWHWSPRSERA